jgi:hypothetical protein
MAEPSRFKPNTLSDEPSLEILLALKLDPIVKISKMLSELPRCAIP